MGLIHLAAILVLSASQVQETECCVWFRHTAGVKVQDGCRVKEVYLGFNQCLDFKMIALLFSNFSVFFWHILVELHRCIQKVYFLCLFFF